MKFSDNLITTYNFNMDALLILELLINILKKLSEHSFQELIQK